MSNLYKVYILVKDKKPIYVGCTSNLPNRLSKHKSKKDFDECFVLSSHKIKKDALISESSIIRFISVFGGDEWLNSRHSVLEFYGASRGYNKLFKSNEDE